MTPARRQRRWPSIARAELDVRLAQVEIRQLGAARYPTLSVRAERQNTPLARSADEGTRILFSVNYAPGAGLASYALTSAAVRRAGASALAVDGARRELADRVESAWLEQQSAQTRLPSLALARRNSAEVLASSQRLFATGRRSWLDLLNAVRELIQAEQAESDTQAGAVGARYRLQLLAGAPLWLNQETIHE